MQEAPAPEHRGQAPWHFRPRRSEFEALQSNRRKFPLEGLGVCPDCFGRAILAEAFLVEPRPEEPSVELGEHGRGGP